MDNIQKNNISLYPYFIWALASSLLFYEILLRVFPNIILHGLQQHLVLDSTELGMFSAAFILAYGLMQIPAGMLIDRFGMKKTLTLSILLSSLSVFLLPFTESIFLSKILRFLMGVGCAGAFLGCMQVIRLYFPAQMRPLLTGITVTIGALGGIVCNAGLVWIVKWYSWQTTVFIIALLGFILAVGAWFLFPNTNQLTNKSNHLLQNLIRVLKQPLTWFVGIICALMYLPYAMFNDLWGQPFLIVTSHLDKIQAGWIVSAIWFGWVIGSPCWGWLSMREKSLIKPLIQAGVIQLLVLTGIIFLHHLSLGFYLGLAFTLGMAASAMNLCYVLGQQINPVESASSSTAVINGLVTLGVIAYLPATGWFLQSLSTVKASMYNVLLINSSLYVDVFASFIAVILLCLLLTIWLNKRMKNYISVG